MAYFAPEAVESRTGAHISLHPQEADGQAPFKTKLARCSLKNIMAIAVLALVAWPSCVPSADRGCRRTDCAGAAAAVCSP